MIPQRRTIREVSEKYEGALVIPLGSWIVVVESGTDGPPALFG
jgi:hypothetical protein